MNCGLLEASLRALVGRTGQQAKQRRIPGCFMRVAVVGRLDRFTDSFPSFFCAVGSEASLVLVAALETMGSIEERCTGPEMPVSVCIMGDG